VPPSSALGIKEKAYKRQFLFIAFLRNYWLALRWMPGFIL
jgi:hypothetical protein